MPGQGTVSSQKYPALVTCRDAQEMATEDQPVFKLQNEFKKLCVDFNKYCTSSGDHQVANGDDSHAPTKATKLNESLPLAASPSENFKPFQNKSRSKHVKVVKKASRLSKKPQYHHAQKTLPAHNKNFPSGSGASCHREDFGIPGPHQSSHSYLDSRGVIEQSEHLYSNIDYASLPDPNEDDTTVNELAGYFDTFVHIPKKMSQMAEMMYT